MPKAAQPALTPEEIAALPYRPCVGLILLNSEGLIFAGQRIDRMLEAWQAPQGGVDPGETPRQAALRELGEEVGVAPDQVEILRESGQWIPYDIPADLIPKLWGAKFRGQTQRWFALRLLADDAAIDIETHEPEFRAWRWMTGAELIDSAVPFKRRTYELVLEEFDDLVR